MKEIGWLVIIAAWVWIDWYQIVKLKRDVNHVVEVILRAGCGILYGGLVFDAQPGMMGVWVILFEVTSFYLFFEITLNIARKLSWDYLGQTSAMDRFLYHRRPLFYLLKLFSAAGMIISIIKL